MANSLTLKERLRYISKSYRSENHKAANLSVGDLEKKEARLKQVKNKLKSQFAGLDEHIEKIFEVLLPWYVFPDAQRRPVTISLWGMTGVGKTSFVLELVKELDLLNYFVSEDLGCWMDRSFQAGIFGTDYLRLSGRPSVILLDEIHSSRTVDENGKGDVKGNLQEVWSLIDSGRVKKSVDSMTRTFEILKSEKRIMQEQPEKLGDPGSNNYYGPLSEDFVLNNLIFNLELYATVDEVRSFVKEGKAVFIDWAIEEYEWCIKHSLFLDFTKSLVFVAGNLDEAFTYSFLVNPDDINAQELHEKTKKISIDTIKSHLLSRFRPEQVARLGSLQFVFPSLSRDSFYKIIRNELNSISQWSEENCKVKIDFDESVVDILFKEGVLPVQGARSVLSAVKEIIEARLPHWLLMGLKENIGAIAVRYQEKGSLLQIFNKASQKLMTQEKLEHKKDNLPKIDLSDAFRTTLAVHEAGHAVVGIVNQGRLPIKILAGSMAWHRGGPRVVFKSCEFINAKIGKDLLATYLAGTVAEKLVLGEELVSTGCSDDLARATSLAGELIKKSGMGSHLAVSHKQSSPMAIESHREEDDQEIEKWLHQAFKAAKEVLLLQWPLFVAIANELMTAERLTVVDLKTLVEQHYIGDKGDIESITEREHHRVYQEYPSEMSRLKKVS